MKKRVITKGVSSHLKKKKRVSRSQKEALPLLRAISRMTDEGRDMILKDVGGERKIYKAMRELARNTLKGSVKLTPRQSEKLQPYNKTLINFCCKYKNICAKRSDLIHQSGGFLQILITAVVEP